MYTRTILVAFSRHIGHFLLISISLSASLPYTPVSTRKKRMRPSCMHAYNTQALVFIKYIFDCIERAAFQVLEAHLFLDLVACSSALQRISVLFLRTSVRQTEAIHLQLRRQMSHVRYSLYPSQSHLSSLDCPQNFQSTCARTVLLKNICRSHTTLDRFSCTRDPCMQRFRQLLMSSHNLDLCVLNPFPLCVESFQDPHQLTLQSRVGQVVCSRA
mmetsp:Transcript_23652/g.45041  ORF Transcript_23652/g.45041 Transcript_23652/m.45041 type:complete len:215 (-) Transcript_23652:324-968(-)